MNYNHKDTEKPFRNLYDFPKIQLRIMDERTLRPPTLSALLSFSLKLFASLTKANCGIRIATPKSGLQPPTSIKEN